MMKRMVTIIGFTTLKNQLLEALKKSDAFNIEFLDVENTLKNQDEIIQDIKNNVEPFDEAIKIAYKIKENGIQTIVVDCEQGFIKLEMAK